MPRSADWQLNCVSKSFLEHDVSTRTESFLGLCQDDTKKNKMRISDMEMFKELDFLREDFEAKRTDEKCKGNERTQKKLASWQASFQTV